MVAKPKKLTDREKAYRKKLRLKKKLSNIAADKDMADRLTYLIDKD